MTPTDLTVTIQPLGNRVMVRPLEDEKVTASGIIIPDTASGEKPQEGEVIALGEGGIENDQGKASEDPRKYLKIGNKVLFGRYAGDDVKLKNASGKDVEVKILHLNSVLGIVT